MHKKNFHSKIKKSFPEKCASYLQIWPLLNNFTVYIYVATVNINSLNLMFPKSTIVGLYKSFNLNNYCHFLNWKFFTDKKPCWSSTSIILRNQYWTNLQEFHTSSLIWGKSTDLTNQVSDKFVVDSDPLQNKNKMKNIYNINVPKYFKIVNENQFPKWKPCQHRQCCYQH